MEGRPISRITTTGLWCPSNQNPGRGNHVGTRAMEPFPAGVAVHERRGKPLLLQAREIPLAKLSETATEVAYSLDRRATMPAGSVQT